MNSFLRQLYLQYGVLCLRHSVWWWGLAIFLLIGLLLGWVGYWSLQKQTRLLHAEQQRIQFERQRMQQSSSQTAATVSSKTAENRFRDLLADPAWISDDLKKVFDLAQRRGLSNEKGEYKMLRSVAGQMQSLEVMLPVKGNYLAIRQWIESLLLKFPNISVDEVAFQRESIAASNLEAKVKLTFWLKPGTAATSLETP
ncbi:MAG: hypothetical protein ACK5PF_04330 [bacterium]|jgi:hypothetical protein